ncbi:MAG: hypothetical protein C4567_11375 [Deltaproteobacteria bacterium]|nr:MAG: hypothetical protein C4567_11375 [Deltaproteobacteria bacterium]
MSKVIDIEDRLKLEQKKKAKVDKAKKLEAVRRTIQCTRCLARCAKCNVQFDTQEMYQRFKGPHRFCAGCQEEYEEFVRLRGTGEQSPYYWHNKAWFRVWETWLDYQQAMKEYGESTEFLDLVREVEWER